MDDEPDGKPNTCPHYVPPGDRWVVDVVATDGLNTVHDRHASGVPAFGISLHTGRRIKIPLEVWQTAAALEVLKEGTWSRRNHSGSGWSASRRDPAVETFLVVVPDQPATPAAPVVVPMPPPRSQPVSAAASKPPELRGTPGRRAKFDRDEVQAHCYRWCYDNGFPDNVSEFCRDIVLPWCAARYDETEVPEEETLRKYVARWIAAWERSQLPPE
jgi:hypothetical protein